MFKHHIGRSDLVRCYFGQVPLGLAWAVSVHKSQGMTLDKVEVNLERAFDYGMAYVALSRVRGTEGLCIKGSIAKKALEADPLVLHFYEKLRSAGRPQS